MSCGISKTDQNQVKFYFNLKSTNYKKIDNFSDFWVRKKHKMKRKCFWGRKYLIRVRQMPSEVLYIKP